MDRIVVCTESDIDMIAKQVNQDMKDENERLKKELAELRKLHPKVRVDENADDDPLSGGCGVCGGPHKG